MLSRLGRLAEADGAMATALYLDLDPATGALQLASAGHPPPLCVKDGRARFVDVSPALSPPLGLAVQSRPQLGLTLPAGSTLVLYTDGLVERTRNIDRGMSELAAAAARLSGATPAELCDRLLAQLAPAARYRDDVAVLALRRR